MPEFGFLLFTQIMPVLLDGTSIFVIILLHRYAYLNTTPESNEKLNNAMIDEGESINVSTSSFTSLNPDEQTDDRILKHLNDS